MCNRRILGKTIAFLIDVVRTKSLMTTIHSSTLFSSYFTKFNLVIISDDELPYITIESQKKKREKEEEEAKTVIYSNPFKVFV